MLPAPNPSGERETKIDKGRGRGGNLGSRRQFFRLDELLVLELINGLYIMKMTLKNILVSLSLISKFKITV